ncbi:MAG: RHS repeat-associated core domain-containing protein, partial [Bacteroidales bacterium]|nr:RHS repeat-associated core domain-containing protein [Bacteroidales bacterium]
ESSPLSAQQAYYTGLYSSADGTRAYNRNIYEASSLGRVNAQQKSGNAYASKQITYTHSTNAANEVLCLKVSYNTVGDLSTVSMAVSYYPAASLYKTTATDEDGGQKIEYKDFKGNVVLERSLISGSTYADTYYSYDSQGRLVWVVSPEGSISLTNGRSYSCSDDIAEQYSYIYAYDGHGNIVEKRLPGRDPEYYVYDKGKRNVMYQDGNMKQSNQWIYTTYDNLGRIAEKTLVSTTNNRKSLQKLYSAETFNNKYENLTNPNIPANATNISVVKILYSGRYHGYTYSSPAGPDASLSFEATGTAARADLSTLTHGALKYEKHLLLTEGTSQQYKETAYYYNNRGELLQTVTKYPNGNILRTSFKYDFNGNITAKEEICGSTTKLTSCTYDTRGKLLTETTKVNNAAAATVTYAYDDLGRVAKRTFGNSVAETQAYNIQGWATTSTAKKGSSNIYSQTLNYYATTKGTTPLYSGNISEWVTQQASQQQETYGLQYDKQGRLTSSSRYSGSSASAQNSFTERGITYDRNGNIKTLQRYNSSLQDNYTYNYTGNKITSITGTDNGTAIASATYSYDNNGNATTDGLKNLQITYNILNLPQKVSQNGATKATYTWFADGSKYSALDNTGNGYHYIGSLIYNTSANATTTLESTDFSLGRIALSGTTQTIHYHHKDHLGSVRAITNGSGTVIEQNSYYPFGGRHNFGISNTPAANNRYKFNGKEEQTIGGLNLLDYGARMYDTKTARWLVQDPLAEKYYSFSAYNYCVNNPVKFVDSDGRKIVIGNLWERSYPSWVTNDYITKVSSIINELISYNNEVSSVISEIDNSQLIINIIHAKYRPDGEIWNGF